jgi:VWFA-related protein
MRSKQNQWWLAFFLLPLAARGAPTDDAAVTTYRSTASEVRVTFFATDNANHPVATITRDDFAIADGDTIIREFRSLARSEETAIDAVILIDSSESVANRLPGTVKGVMHALSQNQSGVGDSLSIISFSGLQPLELCVRNCRGSGTDQKLRSLKASGPTPLFDAIASSANLFSEHRAFAARPVVILFSDGDDTISRLSGSDALQSLIESGALLYAIDLNESERSQGSAILRQMAEATGGRYFSSQQNPVAVLQSVFEDLRASWVVTYEVPNAISGFHALRILPKHNPNLRFHCRAGYYYGTAVP